LASIHCGRKAARGNASIKRDGVMWIKTSGTWLADPLARNSMTPIRLHPLLKAITNGDPALRRQSTL
jgi:rhamnose utilization protein RhaD (predicted bifunctional aldolase and dehydrogenase)